MKDITEYIKKSASQDIIWSVSILFDVIEHMRVSGYDISFWEDEENWVIIHKGNEIMAYLWRKYPLLFMTSQYSINIQKVLNEYNFISFIEVKDFASKSLKMHYDDVKNILDYKPSLGLFSVEDIWFHTNSR